MSDKTDFETTTKYYQEDITLGTYIDLRTEPQNT